MDLSGAQEATLALLPEVFMYKVPPLTTAAGYKAADWNGQHFMSGSAVVVERGDECIIVLKDAQQQKMVECNVSDRTVIPTTDSSRYFVLAMKDPKGHTRFVGIGFTRESNLAAEFTAALTDFKKKKQQMKELKAQEKAFSDLSLKDGEMIHVSIKGAPSAPASADKSENSADTTKGDAPGPIGIIAPPPKNKFHRKARSKGSVDLSQSASPPSPSHHIQNAPTPKNSVDISRSPSDKSYSIRNAPTPQNSSDNWDPPKSMAHILDAPTPLNSTDTLEAGKKMDDNPFFAGSVEAKATSAATHSNWAQF